MAIDSWLMRRLLIFGQRNQRLVVDPKLLAGWTPHWAISFFRVVAFLVLLPSMVWVAAHVVPEQAVVAVGQLADRALWSHLKSTELANCTTACRDLAFGMVALPLTWVAGVGGAFYWNRYLSEAAAYQRQWLSMQPGMTDARRRTIGVFRDYSALVVLIIVLTIMLQAVAVWVLVGELRPDFASEGETANTSLPFAVFCSLMNLCIAAVGGHLLPLRDVVTRTTQE